MVIALKKASARQKRKKPFGPIDIRSLYPLIERGLINFNYYDIMGEKKVTWNVTEKGMRILHSIHSIKPAKTLKNAGLPEIQPSGDSISR
jgi:hypothetical protein